MRLNENIFFVTGDLGFGIADKIKKDFPDRFINVGAAEMVAMGVAVGLTLEGKIVFVYSITPFLLFRTAETIRNYINKELIPVRMVGSGRDHDYHIDGFSHYAGDDVELLNIFKHIERKWPVDEMEIQSIVEYMVNNNIPYYLNLKR